MPFVSVANSSLAIQAEPLSDSLVADMLFAVLLLFVVVYVTISFGAGYRYLNLRLDADIEEKDHAKREAQLNEVYEEWSREQTFSSSLAGFSIAALAFILASERLRINLSVVEFFSFGFIFHTISYLCFKSMTKQGYDFYGTLFQFAGLLALINGFLIFIIKEIGISYMLTLAYAIGYFGFFMFSTSQLIPFIQRMLVCRKKKC